MLVVGALVAGCTETPRPPPVTVDGGVVTLPPCSGPGDSFCAPVGGGCDTDQFCGGGRAWCFQSRCRAFCSPIDFPRCGQGEVEQHTKNGSADVCVCVPKP
jgi:hypothetical protein